MSTFWLSNFFGSVAVVKEEQESKEPMYPKVPNISTLLGIVNEIKEEHLAKAAPPIVVTLSGTVMEVKEQQ